MHFDLPDELLFVLEEGMSPARSRRFQGVAIHREIRKVFPDLPVVLLTSYEDLSPVSAAAELAAQSMTYFLGRDDLDTLKIRINAAGQESQINKEDALVLWGEDTDMRMIRRRLTVLARGRMPVILEGATGTGKSYLAEYFVHANAGRPGPFVVCDLSVVPMDLIPAHLFGAVRGAYTGSVADRKGLFEMAHRGTLFLDEVQNIPLDVQKQLLQVLQDRRVRPLGSTKSFDVDVKLVAASNRPLDDAVAVGRFRSDLYMRLSPATRIRIPPLVERMRDLEFFSRRFVQRAVRDPEVEELVEQVTDAVRLNRPARVNLVIGGVSKNTDDGENLDLVLPGPAWKMLLKHSWPGNIRELQNVMQNIVMFTLVAAVDAVRSGLSITTPRFQVDPGLVGELLAGSAMLSDVRNLGSNDVAESKGRDRISVDIEPSSSLNAVSSAVEKQYFLELYRRSDGDFSMMAEQLLGDRKKNRAVRLRFNQLGLKVRDIFFK
jgi:DNA-binding NtrC family response regulator